MRNPENTIRICDDPDLQRVFFDLSSEPNRLDGRLSSSGISGRLSSISARIGATKDCSNIEVLMNELSMVISEECVEQILGEELDRFASTPLYSVGAKSFDSESFSGMVLFEDEEIRLSLVSIGPMALRLKKMRNAEHDTVAGITIQGSDTLLRFIRAGGSVADFWSAQPFSPNEPLAERRMLEQPSRHVADGDIVFLRGGVDAMSIASCERPIIFVSVSRLQSRTAVNAHYLTSGGLASCTASDMGASRVQMLATLVRELGWKDGADTLIELAGHSDHFVRWHVLRELTALCPTTAYSHVCKAAADDPHPQVRDAALKTQVIIEGVEACR